MLPTVLLLLLMFFFFLADGVVASVANGLYYLDFQKNRSSSIAIRDYKACSYCVFKDVRMPPSVYRQVMDFPMPMLIPKPVKIGDTRDDLEHMSFEDAKLLPFMDEHQPSLVAVVARTPKDAKKKAALNIFVLA